MCISFSFEGCSTKIEKSNCKLKKAVYTIWEQFKEERSALAGLEKKGLKNAHPDRARKKQPRMGCLSNAQWRAQQS
jgi:hypothetical protein